MTQLELELFYPLTEQIPLDLDYSNCHVKSVFTNNTIISNGGTYTIAKNEITSSISLNLDQLNATVTSKNMPWYRRVLYKALGIKVK